MKQTSLPYFSFSKFVLALAFVHVSPLNSLQAMEKDPHDHALRAILESHNFYQDHFFEQHDTEASSERPLKKHIENCSHEMHQENLKCFQENLQRSCLSSSLLNTSALITNNSTQNPAGTFGSSSLYIPDPSSSTFWNYLDYPGYVWSMIADNIPNIPWPSFSYFSSQSPSVLAVSNDFEGSSFGFELLNDTSGNTLGIDTNFQDFRTQSQFISHPRLLGLSGDGGGGRGWMIATWIDKIERETNQPASKVFDLIGGTSISGIGTTVLAASDDGETPKMSGSGLVNLIEKGFDQIFPKPSKYNLIARFWGEIESIRYSRYSAHPLEGLLKKYLGEELTLKNSLTRILITAVNSNTVAPRIFDSANPSDQICKLWEVGLCTSAAPTFFPAHLLSTDQQYYIDGGIAKNNPGLDVLKTLSEMSNFDLSKISILSLGTGDMPLGKIPTNSGISSVGTIVDALIATQSKSVEMTLKELLKEDEQYFRANPKFDRSIALDELDVDNLRLLKEGAESQHEVIEKFIATEPVRKRLEKLADSY